MFYFLGFGKVSEIDIQQSDKLLKFLFKVIHSFHKKRTYRFQNLILQLNDVFRQINAL